MLMHSVIYIIKDVIRSFFKKFGYENFENVKSRTAVLSFHSTEKLEIQITDSLFTNFNYIALMMMIKNHGVIAQEEGKANARNKEIFELKQYTSNDGRVLSFCVENKFDQRKNFEINITSQIFYTYTHHRIACLLEKGDSKYLMTLLAKKIINKNDDNKVLIKLGQSEKH